MFLTPEGAALAHMNEVPPAWPKEDMKKFYATTTHSYAISADRIDIPPLFL